MTSKKEYEHCIMCGEETDVPIDLHIDYRSNYIIGGGQLCQKCADKLEKK